MVAKYLGLMAMMIALVSSQCNYYRSGGWYYPVNRCLTASIDSVSSSNDVRFVCHANGTMTRYDYGANTNCAAASSMSPVTSSFQCGGTDCYVQLEYATTSFSDSFSLSGNCTSRNPKVWIDSVPGLCSDAGSNTFYCGTNGAYAAPSCTPTNSTPYIPFNQCVTGSTDLRISSCSGGPAAPSAGYESANNYANCNYYNVNGTRGPIDKCFPVLFTGTKARCTDANTLEVGSYLNPSCSGNPFTFTTYKRGDPMVDFLCTGNQCIVERKFFSTTDCTGSSTAYPYAAGKCENFGSNKYYCYGTGNNKIFKESYTGGSSSNFLSCQPKQLRWSSGNIYDTGVCIAGSSSSEMYSCSLGGAAPPFGSLSAGYKVSVDVAAWVAALFALLSVY